MNQYSQRIKPYTLASRTKPQHKAKLAKEYAFVNPKRMNEYTLQQKI